MNKKKFSAKSLITANILCRIICLTPLFFSIDAVSEDMPEYSRAGSWTIRVDTSIDYSCFLHASFEGGSTLRLGFNKLIGSYYILAGDPAWKSIEYGKEYPLKIQFGELSKWAGVAVGFSWDGEKNAPWLWVDIDSSNGSGLIEEFMQQHTIKLFYNDEQILNLKLKDSYKAGMEMLRCQEAINETSIDPFATPEKITNDPFAS